MCALSVWVCRRGCILRFTGAAPHKFHTHDNVHTQRESYALCVMHTHTPLSAGAHTASVVDVLRWAPRG